MIKTVTLDEYYQGALEETYKGGYIYSAEKVNACEDVTNIPYAVTSKEKVQVSRCEVDAYDDTMKEEYRAAENHPEYRYFIEKKFGIMS